MLRYALACSALLFSLTSSVGAQRLPTNVTPSHYQLSLNPSLSSSTFSGDETITLNVAQPSAQIILNSLDLDIQTADLAADGKTYSLQPSYDRPSETAHLTSPSTIPAGAATLHITYNAKLANGLHGFYLSKGARRTYAVTQFEGTYARMMFPCFDEPSFKATFDLSVELDKGDTAISNGRIVNDQPRKNNRHLVTFSTSPVMSTYLVALAVGDWQCLSGTSDNIPIRVCAEPDKKDQGQFALEAAEQSVRFYDHWFDIKYPFEKLDLLAIPDFEAGGMENTGSIFFAEGSVLTNAAHPSVLAKRGRASVISHEIAHQWFGDFVTAAWWGDIWLNEGFATWISNKPIQAWHPEWHAEDNEAVSAQWVIATDSLGSTRAIHGDPKTPGDIEEMFDGITYQKGAAILNMLESWVGPDLFRKGVTAYLHAHASANAESADFWKAEAQVSGKPVDQIMSAFVLQSGVPMLTITTECQAEKAQIAMAQQQFFLSPSQPDSAKQWHIPVCFKTATGSSSCTVIDHSKQTVSENGCPSWIFANRDAKGYYRVNYSPENLLALEQVAEKSLTVPERITLIEDTWAMANAEKAPVHQFLHLAQSLNGENNRMIVQVLADHLVSLKDSLVPADALENYQNFVRQQFGPLAASLGWDPKPGETEDEQALRAILLGALGFSADHGAIAAARHLVAEYLQSPSSVDGTLAGVAFRVAAENGNAEFYGQLTDALAKAKSTDEYYIYLFSLTRFKDASLFPRSLDLLTSGKVHQQDRPFFLASLLINPGSRNAAWAYLKSNWDRLSTRSTTLGGSGAISALGNFCSVEKRDDVIQFFAHKSAPGAERTLKQSIERINNCIGFREAQGTDMQAWLGTIAAAPNTNVARR